MQTGRLIKVPWHIDVQKHEVGIHCELRTRASDLIDGPKTPLEQRHIADSGAADAVGKEHPAALDLTAVERPVTQCLEEGRTARDRVARRAEIIRIRRSSQCAAHLRQSRSPCFYAASIKLDFSVVAAAILLTYKEMHPPSHYIAAAALKLPFSGWVRAYSVKI